MKLNGSIPNINLGLSASVIGLMIFTIVVGGYYVTQVKDASEYNEKQIEAVRKNQDAFTKHVLDQQDSTDKVNNASLNLQLEQETQLLNLSRTNDKIIHQQLENEAQIINGTNQTNTLVKFLSDNFGAQSGYLEKENFQYNQSNQTFKILQDNNKLLHQLNNSSNITR